MRSSARGSPKPARSIPRIPASAARERRPPPAMDEGISRLPERQLLEHRDFLG